MSFDFLSFNLESFQAWMQAHPHWLGTAIFLISFAECAAIVGLILPGVIMLFIVAVLAGSGSLGLMQTLLLAFAGGLLGDITSYFIGRGFHQNIRRLPWLRSHPEWIALAEQNFQRYGSVSLLIGRFIGPLRPMLPMVAGMFDMPLIRFISVSILAAAGWSVAYLMPGWTTGAALRLPLTAAFWSQAGTIIVCLAGWILLISQLSLRQYRHTNLLIIVSSLLMLIGISFGWPHLQDLDAGLIALVQSHRLPALDTLMVTITRLADFTPQVYVGIVLTLVLLIFKHWRHALFAAMVMLGTSLANDFLKHIFNRARPEVLIDPLSSSSYPSGHSSAIFALFLVLGVLAGRGQPPRMRVTWLVMAGFPAFSVAFSRLYLGVHWPSDIIGGILLACVVCSISLWAVQRHSPLSSLNPRAWWVILPACLAVMLPMAVWDLPAALQRYRAISL